MHAGRYRRSPDTEPITLTVWDQETGQVGGIWDQLNAEFQARYPNVTVKRVKRDFGELKTLLKLAISGPHPPDVIEVNQGWPDMGGLVRAGLLLPLDNYAEAYGWSERVPRGGWRRSVAHGGLVGSASCDSPLMGKAPPVGSVNHI